VLLATDATPKVCLGKNGFMNPFMNAYSRTRVHLKVNAAGASSEANFCRVQISN